MNFVDKTFMESCVFTTEIKQFFDEIARSETSKIDLEKMEDDIRLLNV